MLAIMDFHELSPADFSTVDTLFSPFQDHICVRSVIAGHTPGRIFLHRRSPKISVLWNKMDAIYIAFPADALQIPASLKDLIINQIAPDAASRYIPVLNLTTNPGRAIRELMDDFQRFKPTRTPRFAFAYRGADLSQFKTGIPWLVRPINQQLLAKDAYANFSDLLGWIKSFWSSKEDFLQHGLGFYALKENTIGSWCLSVFTAGSDYELGVATAPKFRGMGLATAVSANCVQQCISDGLTPHWHCDQANQPSVSVAEKIGFRIRQRYENLTLNIETLIPKKV